LSKMKLKKLLNLTFRKEQTRVAAYEILQNLKLRQRIGKPFKATERERFCDEKSIASTVYDNVLMNLKRYELVRKEDGFLLISDEFIFDLLKEWQNFLKA
jgi:hypothetical protein